MIYVLLFFYLKVYSSSCFLLSYLYLYISYKEFSKVETIEDLTGKIECVVFPKVYAEYESIFDYSGPLIMEGYSNLEESPKKFFPQKIKNLQLNQYNY